jgi:hypothetical protein
MAERTLQQGRKEQTERFRDSVPQKAAKIDAEEPKSVKAEQLKTR